MDIVLSVIAVIVGIVVVAAILILPIHLALKTLFKDREDVGITYRMSCYFALLYFLFYFAVSIGLSLVLVILSVPLQLFS